MFVIVNLQNCWQDYFKLLILKLFYSMEPVCSDMQFKKPLLRLLIIPSTLASGLL